MARTLVFSKPKGKLGSQIIRKPDNYDAGELGSWGIRKLALGSLPDCSVE